MSGENKKNHQVIVLMYCQILGMDIKVYLTSGRENWGFKLGKEEVKESYFLAILLSVIEIKIFKSFFMSPCKHQ